MWYEKKTIYLTDNDQAYLTHTSILLKKMGFNIVPAENSAKLLKLVEEELPDLIILDVNISGIDGIDLLKILRDNEKTSKTPIVMISADSSDETWLKCMNLGCDEYLIKPVNINTMHEVMQRTIYAPIGYTRKNLRVLFPDKVSVTYQSESKWLRSATLSEMGIYVISDDPLPMDAEVEVTIPLSEEKSISLKGCVIYTINTAADRTRGTAGMAIEFREPDVDKLLIISYYVKGLLTIPSL
jgi:CheY-like chemotaxis protein